MTRELVRQDPRYVAHRRLKVGSGNSTGYRIRSHRELQDHRSAGQVLYENERYGNVYAFVVSDLEADIARGVPVLHVGQVAGVRALKAFPARWMSVALWCSRKAAHDPRLLQRGSEDVARRLMAWDESVVDYARAADADFDLVLDTVALSPSAVAERIRGKVAGA